MIEAPALSHDELFTTLGKLYKRRAGKPEHDPWQRQLAAIYGRCERETIEVAGHTVELIPVASEYELRMEMPDPREQRRLAFVLAYPAVEVPVDIAGRFVKRGRVIRLGRHERLRRLFSGQLEASDSRGKRSFVEIEPALGDSALGRYLLTAQDSELRGLASGAARVTLEQAYARWLHVRWRLPQGLACDSWLADCASNDRHQAFAEAVDPRRQPQAAGLLDELLGVLANTNKPELAVIFRCWLAGFGRTLLEFAVLFDAHAAAPDEVLKSAVLQAGRGELGLDEAALELALSSLPEAVPVALSLFADCQSRAGLVALLRNAQSHLLASSRARLHGSRFLPMAWDLRLDAVGEALVAVAEQPEGDEGQDRYAQLSRRVVELELHDSISLGERKQAYGHAEMARRLAAWLVVRNDRRWPIARGPLGKLEALAGWYTQEGGYVDLARRRVRGTGEGRFAQGVRAVLAKVDELRVQQDRDFAEALPKWLEAGRPERRVLPIDKAIERFGAGFLRGEGGTRRKLMILVLDGMAWAQAAELLDELGADDNQDPWQPLAYNREVNEIDPRASFVPVLASLPTMTEFSRSALFSGQPTPNKTSPRTTDDDRRFAKHAAIAGLFPDGRTPSLLGARESFSTDDGLTAAARTLIDDAQQPVVGFLLNTIDSALKSDRLDGAPWTIERIRPLRALFDAAREAGRAVLLCSDHGHVSGQRLRYAGRSGTGSRWRTLMANDTISEFETAIPSPPGWLPDQPGAVGVVLINDDCHAYHGQPNFGEHGGATLAEVVAPTLLLGTPTLASTELGEDRMLALAPIGPPLWWVDEVREPIGRKAAVEAEVERRLAKKQAKAEPEPAQLPLAAVSPKPTPSATEREMQSQAKAEAEARVAAVEAKSKASGKKWTHVSDTTTKLLDKLESNPLFQARAQDPAQLEAVLAALEYLLELQDRAPGEAFAAHIGKHKGRVAGVVSNLSQILNVDGYDVLSYESASKQVVVERELLVQCFGL